MVLLMEDIITESHRIDEEVGHVAEVIEFRPIKNIYAHDINGNMRVMFAKGESFFGNIHSDGQISTWNPALKQYVYVKESKITIIGRGL